MGNKRKVKSKSDFVVYKSELETAKSLHKEACRVRKNAYAPYSKFLVGAAALTEGGIETGCNVENLSLGGTICAERSLICSVVSHEALPIQMLCVVTQLKDNPKDAATPCGLCLQVLAEFCSPNLPIWLGTPKALVRRTTLGSLLPGMKNFKRGAF